MGIPYDFLRGPTSWSQFWKIMTPRQVKLDLASHPRCDFCKTSQIALGFS
ncbi:hypothetical protein Lalb_Chr06g0174571 [Lupinus albus]|uniref:Uncharacterized protein n=1 Tax=Lupinus albus TaxID=3870 RepID=A0A6A4QGF6_LUPAL|nr:hypothetical protein Lalb_Chr06g0174571 [Lupinus albus]